MVGSRFCFYLFCLQGVVLALGPYGLSMAKDKEEGAALEQTTPNERGWKLRTL